MIQCIDCKTNMSRVVTSMFTISKSSNIRQRYSLSRGREHQVVNRKSLGCKISVSERTVRTHSGYQTASCCLLCRVRKYSPLTLILFYYCVLCFSSIITSVIMKFTLNKSFQIKSKISTGDV